MTFVYQTTALRNLKTEALIVPLLLDVTPDRIRGFDADFAELITKLNRHGDWKGEKSEVALLYPEIVSGDFSGIKRILLVGMGKQSDWDYETMRQAVASGIVVAKKRQLGEVSVLLPDGTAPATVRDLATITVLANYEFTKYKTEPSHKVTSLATVNFCAPGTTESAEFTAAVRAGLEVGQAVNFTRDLTNHPANDLTPKHLARDAQTLSASDIDVTVYGKSEIQKMKMGALLAVAKGSVEEPQLIVADYHPQQEKSQIPNPKSQKMPTIALVGKGITFDSGGISIKPSDGMEEMKMDMAGAATALGILVAAKALALPLRLIVVLPVTENLPSGSASKPGDIVTAYNGKTIEILNTDAEGRLVLADGLAYAVETFKPDAIIDLATLTGAAIVALGHEAAPVMGNNQELLSLTKEAAGRTGERIWEFPLWTEYRDQVKSELADVKNLGEGRTAGVIAGGAFLSYFVPEDMPWMHIDIAGTAMMDKARRPYMPKGGSGWGVRLIVDLLENWK